MKIEQCSKIIVTRQTLHNLKTHTRSTTVCGTHICYLILERYVGAFHLEESAVLGVFPRGSRSTIRCLHTYCQRCRDLEVRGVTPTFRSPPLHGKWMQLSGLEWPLIVSLETIQVTLATLTISATHLLCLKKKSKIKIHRSMLRGLCMLMSLKTQNKLKLVSRNLWYMYKLYGLYHRFHQNRVKAQRSRQTLIISQRIVHMCKLHMYPTCIILLRWAGGGPWGRRITNGTAPDVLANAHKPF